ncbi:MAG: Crp/Fnr family transcriptional regulator [Melioribacteraceae bacterium]|jgi:CRP/FNR family cyclic AMP-dependent transcriptional regulator|nr:Crp/Fnr family transcriptional regulator [Melioribacteraceae bacterium]
MEIESTSLQFVPIFADLPTNTLTEIEKIGSKSKYIKDEPILLEEDAGNALFVILSGKVKVSRSSNDGREVILTMLGESDFFGEMAILDGLARSANVIATEESVVFLIQRNDFLKLLHDHPEISIILLQELTSRLRNADMKIKALSLKDAEGKVATVLLQIAEYSGKIKAGVVEISELPIQQDLANMAGTSRETISRTLHSFAKRGFVELEGNKLRIVNFEEFKENFE